MKRFVLRISIITLFVGSLLINTSNAQPINIGGGIVIGTSYPHFGLKVNGTYGMDFLLNNLSASAAFTFFIPSTPGVVTYNRWAIDIDGHYQFFTLNKFDFYAIAGLNLASYSTKVGKLKDSSFKPGVNAGAGALYGFTDNLKAFGEFKYVMGILDQAEITFGLLFAL